MKEAVRWYLYDLSRVISFRGRAGRVEVWSFFFCNLFVCLTLALIDWLWTGFPILLPLYGALSLIPTILLAVRRLHDCGLSGWWSILTIWPPVCFFIMSLRSDSLQPNQYGNTERLPRKEAEGEENPPRVDFDGVQDLMPPGPSREQPQSRNGKSG